MHFLDWYSESGRGGTIREGGPWREGQVSEMPIGPGLGKNYFIPPRQSPPPNPIDMNSQTPRNRTDSMRGVVRPQVTGIEGTDWTEDEALAHPAAVAPRLQRGLDTEPSNHLDRKRSRRRKARLLPNRQKPIRQAEWTITNSQWLVTRKAPVQTRAERRRINPCLALTGKSLLGPHSARSVERIAGLTSGY